VIIDDRKYVPAGKGSGSDVITRNCKLDSRLFEWFLLTDEKKISESYIEKGQRNSWAQTCFMGK